MYKGWVKSSILKLQRCNHWYSSTLVDVVSDTILNERATLKYWYALISSTVLDDLSDAYMSVHQAIVGPYNGF